MKGKNTLNIGWPLNLRKKKNLNSWQATDKNSCGKTVTSSYCCKIIWLSCCREAKEVCLKLWDWISRGHSQPQRFCDVHSDSDQKMGWKTDIENPHRWIKTFCLKEIILLLLPWEIPTTQRNKGGFLETQKTQMQLRWMFGSEVIQSYKEIKHKPPPVETNPCCTKATKSGIRVERE